MDSMGEMGNECANIFLQTFFYRFCPQDPYGYTYSGNNYATSTNRDSMKC